MDAAWFRQKEIELFPEFKDKQVLADLAWRHQYSPAYHFRVGLMNEDIVSDLKEGGRLLVVGSGDAYLERFLVGALGVPADRIALSDREEIRTQGFETHRFDMYDSWPAVGEFQHILFPRSVFLGRGRQRTIPHDDAQAIEHLVRESSAHLTTPGYARMSGYLPDAPVLTDLKQKLSRERAGLVRFWKIEELGFDRSDPDLLLFDKK